MTTAPDLPLHAPVPTVPRLRAVVPDQPVSPDDDFDDALRRATPRLHRYAARRLGDQHEAEEVVQEALLRAFQHRQLLATEDDLMAWLTVVTGRLVIDRLRVRGRSTPVAEIPPSGRTSRDTADVVVAREEARRALDALEAMPGRQASVLWAREVEGLSYDDIGDRFGLSEPSVRSLLHRARRTLRREYAARGGSLPAVGLVALAPWMHGLRHAARVRHLARRGGTAAAVAATGLVAATVVPFGGGHQTAPSTAAAPPLRIKAVQVAMPTHHQRAVDHRTIRPATAHHAVAPRPAAQPTVTAHRLPVPSVCGRNLGAGCETHKSPTLYVRLPVKLAGQKWVGVATTEAQCALIPTTLLTQCDPTKGDSR